MRKGAEAAHKQLEHIGRLFDADEFKITTSLNANNHIMGGTIMGSDRMIRWWMATVEPTTIPTSGCPVAAPFLPPA